MVSIDHSYPGGRTFQKSTGTPIRKEAEKIAMEWLVNGNIPKRINSSVLSEQQINLDKLALLNNLRSYDFNDEDITKILKILKDRKYIISALRTSSKGNLLISDFLSTFWDYEKSPYVKESMQMVKVYLFRIVRLVKAELRIIGYLHSRISMLEK